MGMPSSLNVYFTYSENFLLGRADKLDLVHVIDFGLSDFMDKIEHAAKTAKVAIKDNDREPALGPGQLVDEGFL